jgi:hypothetical protein
MREMDHATHVDPTAAEGSAHTRGATRRPWVAGGVAAGALAIATATIFAGLCCIGPVTFLLLGAGGAVAAAGLAPYRGPLLALSAVLIVAGYWRAYRSNKVGAAACSFRTGRWIRVSLTIASVAWVIGAILWLVER